MADEQYIAMSTANGVIAMELGCSCVFLDARERVDFFKASPLPDLREHMIILLSDV